MERVPVAPLSLALWFPALSQAGVQGEHQGCKEEMAPLPWVLLALCSG